MTRSVMLLATLFGMALTTESGRLEPAFQPGARTYNYAPCLVREPNNRILHVWYCANRTPGDVTDSICYRTGNLVAGRWVWGKEGIALSPSAPRQAWDSRHVCDPEVVAGRFRYGGRAWRYALLYLGCDAESSTHNQVGVAFADSLAGRWTRYPEPIVRYTDRAEGGVTGQSLGWPVYRYWGVGQPAAASLDRAGRILLFFTRGEEVRGEEMATLDLSDMDRGPVVSERRKVPTTGLGLGSAGGLNNISVALDESANRLYMVHEQLPPGDGRFPGFIAARVPLAWIPWDALRGGEGTWTAIGQVDQAHPGWPRNHNACLERDPWGRLPDSSRLTVGISLAEAYASPPPDFAWLWTYRISILDWPLARGGR